MTIEILENQIKNKQLELNKLETMLQNEYNEIFKESGVIKQWIEKLESSKNYACEYDIVSQYTHVDNLDKFSEKELSFLSNYLDDQYFIKLDVKNSSISQHLGFSLIINEDGDVYDQDSGKFVIDSKDYSSTFELQELIKQYQEKSGVFFDTFRVDRYGNTFLFKLNEE